MEEYGRPSGEKTRAFDSTGGAGRERWGVGGHWGVEGGKWVSKAIITKVINTIKVIINKIIITDTKRINTITNFIIKDGRVGVLIGGVGLQGFSGNFLDALASLRPMMESG